MAPTAEILIVCLSAPLAFHLATRMVDRMVDHAHVTGRLDPPTERGSHTIPTPRVGGVALAALVILAAFVALGARLVTRAQTPGFFTPFLLALIVAGALAAVVGYRDDVHGMSPWLKLVGQAVAALCVALAVGRYDAVALAGVTIAPGRVLLLIWSALWVVWVMNMVNFMDGMDGMVSSFTLVALAGFGFEVARNAGAGRGEALLVLAVFIGAMAAFHRRNVTTDQRRKTFMGDCGSQFTGLALGLFSLTLIRERGGQVVNLTAPLILFMPFLFDTIYTMIRRIRRGANLMQAHHEHLYQRALEWESDHGRVRRDWTLILLCQLGLALLVAVAGPRSALGVLALLASPAPMVVYWRRVLRLEANPRPEGAAAEIQSA